MMKTKNILFSVACATSLFFGGAVEAKSTTDGDRVVAVVSGSVITQQDLNNRFELLKRQINRPIPKEQMAGIFQKTLDDLINEEVQNQYADRAKINITPDEVKNAIAEIERRNGLKAGAFNNLVYGINKTAEDKIKSDLIRQKIIDQRLRARVKISKGEIDRLIENINSGKNNWEKEVHQIFISYNKQGAKTDDREKTSRIEEVYNKFSKEGADFHTLAKTFSDDPSAREGKGGYMGWFGAGELAPALDEALISLKEGEVSKPISTPNGWHILYVTDVKEKEVLSTEPVTEYMLYQYQIDLAEAKDMDKARKTFTSEVKDFERLGDMEEMKLRHQDDKAYKNSAELGWVAASQLNPAVLEEIASLEANEFTDIIVEDNMMTVFHLSDKREVLPKKLQEYRNRVHNRLLRTRLELSAKRFMRNLRRQAYIDVRL